MTINFVGVICGSYISKKSFQLQMHFEVFMAEMTWIWDSQSQGVRGDRVKWLDLDNECLSFHHTLLPALCIFWKSL